MSSKALTFKQEGNKCFTAGDYKGAEALYSQAIIHDSTNHLIFTNRAFTRLKLASYDPAIDDCLHAIELHSTSMKAYYYLAQAQLALHHPNEALNSALTAYDLCLSTGTTGDISSVSGLVLKAKKERWEVRERERRRGRSELLAELEDRLEMAETTELRAIEDRVRRTEMEPDNGRTETELVREVSRKKLEELRSVFAIGDEANLGKREVPDYLIDNISFAIMHDPVMTKTGHTYDRSTLLEHLRRSPTDPLTRDLLRVEDLRPNLALRQACHDFLESNGWAVDW